MLKLALFVLPLGLDTFAVSAALGLQGLPKRERLRTSLLLSGFETTMPIVGLLIGRGLGTAIGGTTEYVAGAALIGLGGYMLLAGESGEMEKVASFSTRSGPALFALGLSISVDELAMGFTIGLLGLSIVAAIVLIGGQAFVASQLGLRLGARLGTAAGEWAERLAALALIALGASILVERITA